MPRTSREEAVAFNWLMILIVTIGIVTVLAFLAPGINMFLGFVNNLITAGTLTDQTRDSVSWNIGFLGVGSIIAVGVLFYFGIVKAFEIMKGAGWI